MEVLCGATQITDMKDGKGVQLWRNVVSIHCVHIVYHRWLHFFITCGSIPTLVVTIYANLSAMVGDNNITFESNCIEW